MHSNYTFFVFLPLFVAVLFGIFFLFKRYCGLAREKAALALLGSAIAAILGIYYCAEAMRHEEGLFFNSNQRALRIAATGIFIAFSVAFFLRLWGRWIGVNATTEERQSGLPGIRAWFCASNVSVGCVLLASARFAYDISPLLSAVVVIALLAAYPLIQGETAAATAPSPAGEGLSVEREKIISMLEAGKLTPDESAELLHALGESSRAPARQVPLTDSQRLMLIGAALVGLGFFLPWIVINPGKEVNRMMGQMGQMQFSTSGTFGGNTINLPEGINFPNAKLKTPTMSYSGGDIQRGLGWAALALALTTALLPYLATTLDSATARTIRMLCLGIGGVIVLYLLTENIRFVGIGLVLATGGYALEAAGVLRERRAIDG